MLQKITQKKVVLRKYGYIFFNEVYGNDCCLTAHIFSALK